MKLTPVFFLFVLLMTQQVIGQENQEAQSFRWAILPFQVSVSEWANLGRNLSEILSRVEIENEWRLLRDRERQTLEEMRRRSKISQLLAQEAAARIELDRLRLRFDPTKAALNRAEENYRKIRTERLLLEEARIDMDSVPERLALNQIPAPNRLLSEDASPEQIIERQRLGLLIVPKLLKVRDYLGIVIELFDRDGKTENRYEEWMSPEEVLDRISLVQGWLTDVLLNRPWSRLKIATDPAYAEIWIDDRLRGLGAVDLGIQEPGNYKVLVRAGGFQSYQEVIEVTSGQIIQKQWQLKPRTGFDRRITTDPSGARVWIGGRFQGTTPLEVLSSDEPQYMEIELTGFNPVARTVWPMERELDFVLEPRTEERSLEEARTWFYISLGSFTVSFFSYILFRGLEYEYLQLSNDFLKDYLLTPVGFRTQEQLDKVNLSYTFQQTFQNGGYVLLGVTVALFGWTVWELFRYIDVAERGR